MTAPALSTPIVTVLLETPGSDDLTEITVQTDNRDSVRWDLTRAAEKWPPTSEAAMLWATFMAWSALKRNGHDLGKFTEFNDRCVSVRPVAGDAPDPTSAEVTAAYS